MSDTKDEQEIDVLKEKAELLGISFHPNIGVDSLKKKIDAKIGEPSEDTTESKETKAELYNRIRKQARQLVRIQLSCMDPMKRNVPGEFFEVSNKAIGTIKRYVPFNAGEDGWHVEHAIYKMLKDKKYQSFFTVGKGRKAVKKSKLIPAFGIVKLKPLTDKELKKLAQIQAATRNIE